MTMLFRQVTNKSGGAVGNRVAGWSESIYWVGDNFAAGRTFFGILCQARSRLLGDGALITGQRYELIDPNGRTQTGATVYPGSAFASDLPQVAITFVVPAVASAHVRRFTLRGIPDGLVVEGEYTPPPWIMGPLQIFVLALAGFSLRAANVLAPFVPIMSVDAVGAFILSEPLAFNVGDKVTVKGVSRSQERFPTGQYFISARTDSTHGTFNNWTHGVGFGGSVRPQLVTYPLLDSTTVVSPVATVRKVGRPLSGFRGRASKRA